MLFNQEKIRAMIKSVWAPCAAQQKNPRSPNCKKYSTHEIFLVSYENKKLNSPVKGLNLAAKSKIEISQGRYCPECCNDMTVFLRHVHEDQKVEVKQIPYVFELLKMIE